VVESLTLSRDVLRFKRGVADEWAQLTYDGLWFSALRQSLAAFVGSTQPFVTGDVRLRLRQGAVQLIGRSSPSSLYRRELATYERAEDRFRHQSAEGFLNIFGLPLRTQASIQGNLWEESEPLLGSVPRGIAEGVPRAAKRTDGNGS
jgi:argininosuccinate synthase